SVSPPSETFASYSATRHSDSPPTLSTAKFVTPPSETFASYSATRHSNSPPTLSTAKSEDNLNLQDVVAAAHAAAETAERAAAAARSAASLAQLRISELTKMRSNEHISDSSSENPFYAGDNSESTTERDNFTE
ncbi:IST1-like protein, partial [Trifolium medium]|nr:IST1-like protein [Trifolium medium]